MVVFDVLFTVATIIVGVLYLVIFCYSVLCVHLVL